MFDYDVAYLGSGHSCWHGTLTLKAAGKKVVLMDHDLPGGTCTNYGCDAKILLDGPFEFVDGLQRYENVCVDHAGTIDWKKLMAYKKQQLAPFAEAIPAEYPRPGIPAWQPGVSGHRGNAGAPDLHRRGYHLYGICVHGVDAGQEGNLL